MKKMILILSLLLALVVPSLAQSTPTGNFFTFNPQIIAFTAGSTGNVVSLCNLVTGIHTGNSQNVDHTLTTVLKFRFGNFGTLNSQSNFRVIHDQSVTSPISAGDFSVSVSGQNIVALYSSTNDDNFAYHDLICVDANFDAPASSSEDTVDYTFTLNSTSAQTEGKTFFAR